MKRKIYVVLTMSMMFFIFLVTQVQAGGDEVCNSTETIVDYINVEMYEDAVRCAKQYIEQPGNITDIEAHFLWGKACLFKGDYPCAEGRFNVDSVRMKYSKKIAGLYREVADERIDKGAFSSAQSFYRKVAQYDSKQGVQAAKDLFSLAIRSERASNNLLMIASIVDPAIKKDIAEHFYSLCMATTGETSIALLKRANYYANGKYSKELREKELQLGYQYLDEARRLARIPGKEKEVEVKKEKATVYLSKDIVQKELPVYKVYTAGTYTFSLKAGQQTDHWIAPSVGKYDYSFNTIRGSFKIVYDDGEVVDSRTARGLPKKTNFKFKIQAIDDIELEMDLREV